MSESIVNNPSSNAKRWQAPAVCLVLAAITFAVFSQTLRHEFVNYDDNEYVYDNPVVAQGLTRKSVLWAFSSHAYNWHPLTWLSHMLDCQLYGLNPSGHHLTNVLLHTATVIVLFLVLRQMTGALWRSAFVAAVFAIHPLRVESVAWVAERKDVLSGLFFILTIGAYVRYARHPWSRGRYGLVLLLFALGLMSKPMLVTLPLVLLLLDYWPLERKESAGKLVLEKLPLLALSAASCVATLLAQTGAIQSTESFSVPLRLGNALLTCMVYLRQMVYPAGLVLLYPYPHNGLPGWQIALTATLLAGLSVVAFWQRRKQPWILVGWLWYVVMLLPVAGIIQVGQQAHADRYTYLPQIGIYVAITWLVAGWVGKQLAAGLMAIVIAVLMFCSWQQTAYWKNSETLWTHTLACMADNYVTQSNLGNALRSEISPDYAAAHYNLGNALRDKGRLDEAIAHFQETLQIKPDDVEAYQALGISLYDQGKLDEAIVRFQQVLQLRPDHVEAHYNLGLALLQKGSLDEAIVQFQQALQLSPRHEGAHGNLGIALFRAGRTDEAILHFQEALQINPDSASPQLNLGLAFFRKGNMDEAIVHFQKALQIKPAYAEAHYNLGNALIQKGRTAEAIGQYQQALQINPADAKAQINLAWLLATSAEPSLRNGSQAVKLAQKANELTGGGNLLMLHTLAAAFAEAGQFADAVSTVQKAMAQAQAAGRPDLAQQFNGELQRYEAGLPLHD